jgi:hypothetical protein
VRRHDVFLVHRSSERAERHRLVGVAQFFRTDCHGHIGLAAGDGMPGEVESRAAGRAGVLDADHGLPEQAGVPQGGLGAHHLLTRDESGCRVAEEDAVDALGCYAGISQRVPYGLFR